MSDDAYSKDFDYKTYLMRLLHQKSLEKTTLMKLKIIDDELVKVRTLNRVQLLLSMHRLYNISSIF
jgi:hypothetical protein